MLTPCSFFFFFTFRIWVSFIFLVRTQKMAAKHPIPHESQTLHHMLKLTLVFLIILVPVIATPPACFLSCINELAHYCPGSHHDLLCLCQLKESLVGCLVDICPVGNLDAGRDHFVGTCLEHGRPHVPVRHAIPPEQAREYIETDVPTSDRNLPGARSFNYLMKQGTPQGRDGLVINKREVHERDPKASKYQQRLHYEH